MGKLSLRHIAQSFVDPFSNWEKIEIFRRVLYLFLLFNTLTLLPIADELWAYHGTVGSRGWNFSIPTWRQGGYPLLNVLSHPANSTHTWVYMFFVVGQILFLVTGIFRFMPRLSGFMIYFFTINLFLKGYMMFTGGEVLVNMLLFYLMFIHRSNAPKFSWSWKLKENEPAEFSFLQNVMNNTFYRMLQWQICILYFFSTLYKLMDPYWTNGTAVMYISRIDSFSGDMSRFFFANNYTLSAIVCFLVLLYSALFPVLVWVRKIKIPFLLCGVLFHLGIAFGMGIFTFGIIMCLVYLLFLDMDQIDRIRAVFRRKKAITQNA
jgi:hypothetical protein